MHCCWVFLVLAVAASATAGYDERLSGIHIVEGDIALTERQYMARKLHRGRRQRRMITSDESKRWKNATVWYTVAMTFYSDRELKEMRWALDQWEQETCLKFKPATRNTPNYIMVRLGNGGCNALLGQAYTKPTAQFVNLGRGCRHYGLYLHEFGHAIGLYHEHQHPDRDTMLKINMTNVQPRMRQWFKIESDPFSTFGAPYDIQSIMHYGEKAFGMKGKITMTTKNPAYQKYLMPVWLKDMSFYDAWKVNAAYKCASHCKNVKCPKDAFINKDCKCVTKEEFAKKRCIDIRTDCQRRKASCDSKYYWMWKACRKTCGKCYEAI